MNKKYFIGISLFFMACFTYGQTLSDPNLENFQIRAKQKAEQFSGYIQVIASKSHALNEKNTAIKQAIKLFISDTVTVQVSFCPKGAKPTIYQKSLIKYLIKLSMLNYDRVTIDWIDVVIVEELRKGPDGNFYGHISFVQKFVAEKGDYVYSDQTRKDIEIVLKPYQKPNDLGETEWHWEVYLSNVNIVEPCS
jgi:hypothetical protein